MGNKAAGSGTLCENWFNTVFGGTLRFSSSIMPGYNGDLAINLSLYSFNYSPVPVYIPHLTCKSFEVFRNNFGLIHNIYTAAVDKEFQFLLLIQWVIFIVWLVDISQYICIELWLTLWESSQNIVPIFAFCCCFFFILMIVSFFLGLRFTLSPSRSGYFPVITNWGQYGTEKHDQITE